MIEPDAETWRDAQKMNNHFDFPYTATVMDALAIFNPRLIWAEENGRRIGRERD